MKFAVVLLMLFGVRLLTCTAYQQTPDQYRLELHLFENYDKQQLPSLDQSGPTVVNLGMSLKRLKRLNFAEGSMVLNVRMEIAWRDSRLVWDPTEFADITEYHVYYSDIWTPNIAIYNSNLPKASLQDVFVDVDFHGNVNYSPRMKLDVNCTDLDQGDDTHSCSVKVASWSYGSESVSVSPSSDTIDLSRFKENPVWEIVSTEAVKESVTFPCCIDVYENIMITLVVRRRDN